MTFRACLVSLALVMASPETRYFQFSRPIVVPPQSAGQTCITIDPPIFAHAAPGLADLRVYHDTVETPYVVHSDAPMVPEAAPASITPLNLGTRGGHTVFDTAMPDGSYRDLEVVIDGHDFIASVTVSGSNSQAAASSTRIGTYTIFDLTSQKLGRSTVLHLPESDYRYLHFQFAGPIAPENVHSVQLVRLPLRLPDYVTVAESAQSTNKDRSTIYEFQVPANVPVDRVAFLPGAHPAEFSRDVTITVAPQLPQSAAGEARATPSTFGGELLRMHRSENSHAIDEERLSVEARYIPASPPNTFEKVTVSIHNGDDEPLAIDSVRLQMQKRDLCFDVANGQRYALHYGDSALERPSYDYARLFTKQAYLVRATLGPEQQNPQFQPRPDQRPFTETHRALLWVALGLVILLLSVIALRSAKTPSKPPTQHT